MPNYKVFQDYADELRVKVYGTDSGGDLTPFKTTDSGSLYVSPYSGAVFAFSGTVDLNSGDIVTVVNSGDIPLYVRGWSGASGYPVFVQPAADTTFAVSGAITQAIDSGSIITVVNSGNLALFVRGYSGDSGEPVFVAPGSGATFNMNVYSHNYLDSGLPAQHMAPGSSGTDGNVWEVIGYNSWTLAVKYSGVSGEAAAVKLQMSPIGSGSDAWLDDGVAKDFSAGNWVYVTPNYHVRYARLWFIDQATTDSGDFLVWFQGEY